MYKKSENKSDIYPYEIGFKTNDPLYLNQWLRYVSKESEVEYVDEIVKLIPVVDGEYILSRVQDMIIIRPSLINEKVGLYMNGYLIRDFYGPFRVHTLPSFYSLTLRTSRNNELTASKRTYNYKTRNTLFNQSITESGLYDETTGLRYKSSSIIFEKEVYELKEKNESFPENFFKEQSLETK